ncbi:hypothetical protein CVT24_009012 [Panaeolus cyanescens]|uniref:Potassium channel domain-containing protein n=1 Tax=Panaeolus cyanescens TaxID=181874 RepID=A0A409YAN4_9AGAR|nr:hypothetical protein CVT24_009012 [Panaeolus cyanescens]
MPQNSSPTFGEYTQALLHIVNMTAKPQLDDADPEISKQHGGIYQPTFWWFTETAFPLIAGTFGPVANLFSVCALVWTWRVQVPDGGRVPDPAWLTVLNSCSLAVSFVANIVLLLNFARRIPYLIAQIITISFWYLACILLVIPIALTHIPSIHPDPSAPLPETITRHPLQTAVSEILPEVQRRDIPTSEMAYSQEYYYGLISCIHYAVIATLLLWNVLGAYKFKAYPPSFATLTASQRTLMLQTMAFVLYLALGGGVFSRIQAWGFSNAIYWADYTLLTIGLGSDFPVTTVQGRIVVVPYAAFGICFLGLVIGSVRGLVVERAKYKFSRRYLGKARSRLGGELRKDQEAALAGQPIHVDLASKLWHRYTVRKTIMFLWTMTLGPRTVPLKIKKEVLHPWHRAEFDLMRLIESTAEKRQRFTSISVAFLAFLLVWLVGAVVFWVCEHKSQDWTYPTSLYFTYTTLLTVGYGDYYPTSPSGKPFFVAWSLIAVPTMTVFIGTLADTLGAVVRDTSIWIGRWTILPERRPQPTPTRATFRSHSVIMRHKYMAHNHANPSTVSQEGATAESSSSPPQAQITHIEDVTTSNTASPVSAPKSVNTHSHHHSLNPTSDDVCLDWYGRHSDTRQTLAFELSRAVGDLSNDLGQRPPKKYSWDEWVYFLELLHKWPFLESTATDPPTFDGGQSEGVDLRTGVHAAASASQQIATKPGTQPTASRELKKSRSFEVRRQREADEHQWTWLNDNGPLFSKLSETEWLIERVCWRLEEVLDFSYTES